HVCPTRNSERTAARPRRDVPRVAPSEFSPVLVGRVSLKHRHVDASRRPGLACSATVQFALLAGCRCIHVYCAGIGVYADLIDRRKLLIYTQIVAGITALVLGTLVVTGVVKVWMILGLSFITGCCMTVAGPSYLALVFDLVGREDLANAIALNSTQFQLARVLGPVAAGVGFKVFGLAGCFFANGVSFVAVVVSL